MIVQRLERNEDEYYISIPEEEVTRLNLCEGDWIQINVRAVYPRESLSDEILRYGDQHNGSLTAIAHRLTPAP